MTVSSLGASLLTLILSTLLVTAPGMVACGADQAVYVGSAVCGECHSVQYDTFKKHSKKSKSFSSIERMAGKLTDSELRGCYGCHTTGYGKPGGFLSMEETPHLKNASCEVCHGPGSLHVESQDPADLIETIRIQDCKTCHNPDRVAAFNFEPLLHGGAH